MYTKSLNPIYEDLVKLVQNQSIYWLKLQFFKYKLGKYFVVDTITTTKNVG